MAESSEKHEFQAEVNRLMDIIINSLYTDKQVLMSFTGNRPQPRSETAVFFLPWAPNIVVRCQLEQCPTWNLQSIQSGLLYVCTALQGILERADLKRSGCLGEGSVPQRAGLSMCQH
eukprot:946223-Amphidinium_carterae.4